MKREKYLQTGTDSYIISLVDAVKEESKQAIEPRYLANALASGIKLSVGQMNKTEHVGIIRDIGRYEVNLDVNGSVVTLLKQEITHFTTPHPIFDVPPSPESKETSHAAAPASTRPNVQQEFLDKAIREKQVLTIFLINGNRIKAQIEAYDNFTVLLKEGGRQHLFYKHAITTINR